MQKQFKDKANEKNDAKVINGLNKQITDLKKKLEGESKKCEDLDLKLIYTVGKRRRS